MSTCPRTPSRKARNDNRAVVLSPYFSPTRSSTRDPNALDWVYPLHQILDKNTCKLPGFSELDDEDDSQDEDDPILFKDPLFCYYFRNYARLYQQLSLVKPALVQEKVSNDPWKLLVAVTLLNKTAGKLAIPVFWEILVKWHNPWALSQANELELETVIRHLGTQSIRANRLISLSRAYLLDPPSLRDLRPSKATVLSLPESPRKRERYPATPISHLPGTGPYALDSYRIFCTAHDDPSSEEWKFVVPTDKELVRYLKWKWAFFERKEWNQGSGIGGSVTIPYLTNLIIELAPEPRADT